MASKAGSRIGNIIKRIPTGAITNPNTNENIKFSIALEVETKNSHWVRPEEVAQGQADALWKVIDHNKDQLKPGTVEISQRWEIPYSHHLCFNTDIITERHSTPARTTRETI